MQISQPVLDRSAIVKAVEMAPRKRPRAIRASTGDLGGLDQRSWQGSRERLRQQSNDLLSTKRNRVAYLQNQPHVTLIFPAVQFSLTILLRHTPAAVYRSGPARSHRIIFHRTRAGSSWPGLGSSILSSTAPREAFAGASLRRLLPETIRKARPSDYRIEENVATMSHVFDSEYSQHDTVEAIRDYFAFCTKLFLDAEYVVEPPPGGWPQISQDSLGGLSKSDAVIDLLRHMPYLRRPSDQLDDACAGPQTEWVDWISTADRIIQGKENAENARFLSEGIDDSEIVPAHVVGLAASNWDGDYGSCILLDTELGICIWTKSPRELTDGAVREKIRDDPFDYAPEEEAEWRSAALAWPVADFFEVLKGHFSQLNFIPISPWQVYSVYMNYGQGTEGMIPALQAVYRQHGWPHDLSRFDKRACLKAVHEMLRERYPDHADFRVDARS